MGDTDRKEQEGGRSSVYSYSYRDSASNRTVREGDYRASAANGAGTGEEAGGRSEAGRRAPASDPGYKKAHAPRREKRSGNRSGGGFAGKLARCTVLAAVFGLVAGGIFIGVNRIAGGEAEQTAVTQTEDQTEVSATSTTTAQETSVVVSDVSGIVEEVMPSIVSITNMSQTEYYTWFGQTQVYDSESCGSGIIVADDDDYLYIATNHHVVSGATSLTICFSDESTVAGEVKGTDTGSDLAVVSVKKDDLSSDTLSTIRIATLGDSDSLKVGEPSVAIGNALGYGQSVTSGVISALNREVSVTDSDTGETVTNELIQTDAAINPGNSGGALLNIKGEVIGINSVKYSDTSVEGIGYAIPISTAGPIIDELISREKVDEADSAYLGVTGVDVTSAVSKTYSMPEGLYVAQVAEGSAAEAAGLQRSDIITSFDGHSVTSMNELEEQLQYCAAGTTVEVIIQRSDNGVYQEKTLSVTLGKKN